MSEVQRVSHYVLQCHPVCFITNPIIQKGSTGISTSYNYLFVSILFQPTTQQDYFICFTAIKKSFHWSPVLWYTVAHVLIVCSRLQLDPRQYARDMGNKKFTPQLLWPISFLQWPITATAWNSFPEWPATKLQFDLWQNNLPIQPMTKQFSNLAYDKTVVWPMTKQISVKLYFLSVRPFLSPFSVLGLS